MVKPSVEHGTRTAVKSDEVSADLNASLPSNWSHLYANPPLALIGSTGPGGSNDSSPHAAKPTLDSAALPPTPGHSSGDPSMEKQTLMSPVNVDPNWPDTGSTKPSISASTRSGPASKRVCPPNSA